MNIDPFTGEEFSSKRSNQKFANRANQIAYNNFKAKNLREAKASVDKRLETNRRILARICEDASLQSVSKDYLLGAGFDFRFFSQSVHYRNVACQVVYNYLMVPSEKGYFTIKMLK